MTPNPYDRADTTDAPAGGAEGAPGPVAQNTAATSVRKASKYRTQMARANVMLAVLFIGGTAAVYGVVLRKRPAEAMAQDSAAEARVDTALLRIAQSPTPATPAAGRMTRELLRSFYTEISSRQIPLSDLKKDPFVFVPPRSAGTVSLTQEIPAADNQRQDDQRDTFEQAQGRFALLRLQSIMMGRGGGSAIISSNLVTVGQKIDGFTVQSITPKTVVLAWQDKTFTLKMQ